MDFFPTIQAYFQSLFMVIVFLILCFFSGVLFKIAFFSKIGHFEKNDRFNVTEIILVIFLGLFSFFKIAFILALVDFLYIDVFIVLALSVIFGYWHYSKKRSVRFPLVHVGHFLTLLLLLFLGFKATAPLIGSDDISYHLPYARSFLENHGLTVQSHLIYPFQTLDMNVLYAVGLMVGDEIFLRMLNISFMALTVLFFYDFVRSKTNAWIALIVPLIIYSSDKIQFFSLVIYVDYGYAFFASISFVTFIKWKESLDPKMAMYYLVISALGIAQAASTKYFGLVCGLIIFLFFVYYSSKKLKDSIVFLSICAVFGTWWYIRNFILSGNPVHPFLSDFFGHYIWNQTDLDLNLMELRSYGTADSFNHYFKELKQETDALSYYFYASVLLTLFFRFKQPYSFLVKTNLILAAITILFSLFWYFSAHINRYLLPVLGTACATIVISIYILLNSLKIDNKWYTKIGVLMVFSYFSFPMINHDFRQLRHNLVQDHDAYLRNSISGYRLLIKANELQFENRRIYQVGFADKAYYYDGVAAGHWMGEARWSDVADTAGWALNMNSAQDIFNYLEKNQYSAIVLSKKATFDREDVVTKFNIVFEDEFGLLAVPKDKL